jgi:hypothetical protein
MLREIARVAKENVEIEIGFPWKPMLQTANS